MRKECAVFVLLLVMIVVYSGVADAVGVGTTTDSATQIGVDISGASNLYAYEVNFSIDSGSVSGVTSSEFLGAADTDASYGYNVKNGYLYVYGSRLDNSRTGKDGSGELFNITHSGSLTLRGLLAIDVDGDEEYVSYNVPSSSDTSSSTSSASGSGGAITATPTTVQERKEIVVVPEEFSINVVENKKAEREFTITNNGNSEINLVLSSEGLGGAVTFGQSSFQLAPSEGKSVSFDILSDERKLLVGSLLLTEGEVIVKKIPTIINVRSENFLFDAKLTVPLELREIETGENLFVDIDLLQVGPEEKVDVVANYIIKDFSGNVLLEESETFFVLGGKTLSKELHTAGFPPGKYVVGLEIVYPGAFAVSSAQFSVLEKRSFSVDTRVLIIGAISIAIAIALIVSIWAVRKKPGRKKKRERV